MRAERITQHRGEEDGGQGCPLREPPEQNARPSEQIRSNPGVEGKGIIGLPAHGFTERPGRLRERLLRAAGAAKVKVISFRVISAALIFLDFG